MDVDERMAGIRALSAARAGKVPMAEMLLNNADSFVGLQDQHHRGGRGRLDCSNAMM
jgi:hypothetical protein